MEKNARMEKCQQYSVQIGSADRKGAVFVALERGIRQRRGVQAWGREMQILSHDRSSNLHIEADYPSVSVAFVLGGKGVSGSVQVHTARGRRSG
jgi:hypothetical protein